MPSARESFNYYRQPPTFCAFRAKYAHFAEISEVARALIQQLERYVSANASVRNLIKLIIDEKSEFCSQHYSRE